LLNTARGVDEPKVVACSLSFVMLFAGGPHYLRKGTCRWVVYQGIFFEYYLKIKENIISTAFVFGRVGVGLRTKDRNPTSQILPQILPQELLRL
jgi:hypothetical protein